MSGKAGTDLTFSRWKAGSARTSLRADSYSGEKRMRLTARRRKRLLPRRFDQRWMRRRLALLCVCVAATAGWAQAAPAAPGNAQAAQANAGGAQANLKGVLTLDSGWRFQAGDDPRWADPEFDDSNWTAVDLNQPLVDQGIDSYSGYGWYRIRLAPGQLAQSAAMTAGEPAALLAEGNSVGQLAVYVNGVEAARTRGMTDPPRGYESPPLAVPLPKGNSGAPLVLAIRTWAGAGNTIRRGLLTKVELGAQDEINDSLAAATARNWDEHAIASSVVAFLFLCVALLGAALYLAQRNHAEYLWLTLLCLAVAVGGADEVAFALGAMALPVYIVLALFTWRVFMAVTLEFVLRFTASPAKRTVRIAQGFFLLVPFFSLLHFEETYEVLAVSAEIVFCGLVCILLFRAWRKGLGEAGVMLIPFFLAATGDSADTVMDYFASKHWLPDSFASHRFHAGPIIFSTSTIAYTVFLASLVAVILYRFIRVSQDEQRAYAEVSAARSVQALLIPTQLPSNSNFMLESAYLPVNGVGGDFFQVLPVKDDSLLIVVGDVSGKGLQAAMNSSTLVGALRNELSHDPATVLQHLNRVLLGAVPAPGAVPELDAAPCFATCLCARIYPDGTLTVANAGHLSPYRDGREMPLPPGLPLGVIAENQYEQTRFQLHRGDRLVFLSDGVVEATNAQGELFGFERTQQVSHESARYIASAAKHFGQTDDITVVSLYVASKTAVRDEERVLTN
jgi:phosphoserine phosphatase RsbU/P